MYTIFLIFSLAFAYDGPCHYRCDDCAGPTVKDWISCKDHSSFDNQNACVCDTYWAGPDCSTYIGKWHSRCRGCNGPSAGDCDYCIPNAVRDSKGSCVWAPGYVGDKCSQLVLEEFWECDPMCVGCTGKGPQFWLECVEHAEITVNNTCMCDKKWGGPDWSMFIYDDDQCDSKCANGWYDMTNYDWVDCIIHASRTQQGACVCDFNWYGESWQYYNPNLNFCDPKCLGGWDGATAYDCNACIHNSTLNQLGECICDSLYTGDDCSVYIGSRCNPICRGCTGFEDTDCIDCVDNAMKASSGSCVCKIYWTTENCSVWVGPCSSKCQNKCFGPDSDACEECVIHATRKDNDYWECDQYWTGEDCSVYKGPCSPKCFGCFGPSEGNCKYCVPHATRDEAGDCVCDNYWTGEDCSVFSGICNPKCTGECFGPTAGDCSQCVDNATFDKYGYCICDQFWTGTACEIYVGICDAKCLGCEGPFASQCVKCTNHATKNQEGICECDPGWTDVDCNTYTQECSAKCIACHGPQEYDCDACVENAHLNEKNICVCDVTWSGNSCGIFNGKCNSRCKTCYGPHASQCDACGSHSHFDENNFCICSSYWVGQNCSVWEGPCDAKCTKCHGPLSTDCDTCVSNSHRDQNSLCICDNYWVGERCDQFNGPCNPICMQEYGCTGLDINHCNLCEDHATWNSIGQCKCDTDWTGSSCSSYKGKCHPIWDSCAGTTDMNCIMCVQHAIKDREGRCNCLADWGGSSCDMYLGTCHEKCEADSGCLGPQSSQCIQCTKNSIKTSFGQSCECVESWGGPKCDQYVGHCDHRCEICLGPGNDTCAKCSKHALFDEKMDCVCGQYWSGVGCAQWTGECHLLCAGECTGPSARECKKCIEHAHQNDMAECACIHNRAGPKCEIYQGECDWYCEHDSCNGPFNTDCLRCTANAYRNQYGECTCDSSWINGKDAACSVYVGGCASACDGCLGPNETDCIECADNAEMIDGICQCKRGWTGVHCVIFSGACTSTCKGCFGPDASHCVACRDHAEQDKEGFCVCDPGWSSEDCSIWNGDCHHTCHTCEGFLAYDCIECIQHAFKDTNGLCNCSSDWSSENCDEYFGTCAGTCAGCTGPHDSDCISCAEHAELVGEKCVCSEGWTGEFCQIFNGACHQYCVGCMGPNQDQCVKCIENSQEDMHGNCVCESIWSGDVCDIFDQDSCANTCRGCDGPDERHCFECVDNAYRDQRGSCVCKPGWTDELCEMYEGSCDSRCDGCDGPSNKDCYQCKVNTESVDGGCVCSEGWAGLGCELWQGPCDGKCRGCHGPTAFDCELCKTHAYRSLISSLTSQCECEDGWFGEMCQSKSPLCHAKCGGQNNCDPNDDPNICTNCNNGFALHSGECIPCDPGCKTCELRNQTYCTSCFEGHYADDGECLPCMSKCRNCVDASDHCTQCRSDSIISQGDCHCIAPHVRNPTTLKCEATCPSGFNPNAKSRACERIDLPKPVIAFDYNSEFPLLSIGTATNVSADYCSPPFRLPGRGLYFNGSASLEVINFYIHSTHTISLWARHSGNTAGTLLTYEYKLWEGWDQLDKNVNSRHFEKYYEYIRTNNLITTQCNMFKLKTDSQESAGDIEGMEFHPTIWNYFAIVETSNFNSTLRKILLNNESSAIVSLDSVATGPPNGKLFIGSYEGYLKFFDGFISDFEYYAEERMIRTTDCQGLCEYCPVDGCRPTCDFDEFISSTGECQKCHGDWERGCNDFGACYNTVQNCHSSCRTCTGPGIDQCLDCWCGASRTSLDVPTSACTCKAGWTLTPDGCEQLCFEGCEICRGSGPSDCLRCQEFYHLVTNALIASAQGYCEWCYVDLYDRYPTCKNQEWNYEIEACMCEPGQWFDGSFCRHCSQNCKQCDTEHDLPGFHCSECVEGYYFLVDSDVWVNYAPTGYGISEDSPSLIGIGQYVLDFQFKFGESDTIHRNWEFSGVYVYEGDQIDWEVHLFGGSSKTGIHSDDPLTIDDRGLWFDGNSHFLSVNGLTINHTFTMSSWIKPHGYGTLFHAAGTDLESFQLERSLLWSISEYTVEWSDTFHHSISSFNGINMYEWQHSSIMIVWEQKSGQSSLYFAKNGTVNVSFSSLDFISLDFPQSQHIIGATRSTDDTLNAFYKGFMYSFRIFNGETDFTFEDEIKSGCLPCSVCPTELDQCLGVCSWNFYFSTETNKCERCPYWCEQGCQKTGTC